MSNRNRAILVGVLGGAAAGLIAAIVLSRKKEGEDGGRSLTRQDGVKLAMLVVGFLRSLAKI